MIRFAPAILPRVVKKIRRTLIMSVIMTLKMTYSNVYLAPQSHNSLGLEIKFRSPH